MIDILDVCEDQVGRHEAADGTTSYGKWLDAQPPKTTIYARADWCASSAIYCIAQIPGGLAAIGGLHKSDAYVQNWHDRMSAMGRVSMTPKPRRIVFYDWRGTGPDDNHVGVLKEHEGGRLHVYEGNHDDRYELVNRPFDGQVVGFAEWWSFVAAADDDWFIQP
ncbi:CHAP domain-containing protein [Actinoallomurus acaciae]|uniref:CHAP domain-containing protein n=1 Tax=Actinoallomurus acaciae TaxID=502577 RepID=A0ABV5YAV8_9ACTN